MVPVKSDGATVIKDPQGTMRRWKEHFTDLFFNPSIVVDDAAIDSIPQTDLIEELDDEPTQEETVMVIKKINASIIATRVR